MNSGLICIVSPCDWRLQSCKTYLIYKLTTCDSLTASPPQKNKSTAKWYCHVAVNIWRNFGAFHLVQQTQGWLPLKTLAFSCICWAKIDTHRLQSTQNCWQGATFTSCNGCIVANGIWQNLPRYFGQTLCMCICSASENYDCRCLKCQQLRGTLFMFFMLFEHCSQEFCHHWGSKCPTLPGRRICHHVVQHAQSR